MQQKDEYSSFKIVHHPEILSKLKNGEDIVPLQVHFVPTNRCNQRCSFCAYRMKGYSSAETFEAIDEIPTEKAVELIHSMAKIGVKAIQFTGGGEPLVHKGIVQILEACVQDEMQIAMVTNGLNLRGAVAEILAKYGSWVRISVDAGTDTTYAQTRSMKPGTYEKVLDNIKNFVDIKSQKCIVGVGFVVTKDNYNEVYDSAKIMRDIGVDNFRISAVFTPDGISYFDEFGEEAAAICSKTKNDIETQKFTVFNLFSDREADLLSKTQNYDFCPMKNLVVYLGADLNLYTCCILSYNKNGLIGTVKDKSFEELWNSEERKSFYKIHNPRVQCQLPCMFEKKNDFINYCIKKDPKHIEYI